MVSRYPQFRIGMDRSIWRGAHWNEPTDRRRSLIIDCVCEHPRSVHGYLLCHGPRIAAANIRGGREPCVLSLLSGAGRLDLWRWPADDNRSSGHPDGGTDLV